MPEKRVVPEKVWLLERIWTVEYVPLETGVNGGTCLASKQELGISDNLCAEQQWHSLCHEITEGINDDMNLGLDHTQVTILGAAFCGFILNNLPILEKLRSELETK